SFTVTASRTLVANFSLNAYTITTSSNPTAGGNTSGGGTYNYGDTATVSATANAGYTFVNWTEGGTVVSTDEDYSFTVTSSRTLVANFSTNQYIITTSSNPTVGGTTSGGGTYNYGDTATVSATANVGYTFINWTEGGTVVSNDEDYSFTVTSSRDLVANFSQDEYIITTVANPTVGGTTAGGGTYHYGDTATVVAVANPNYNFVNWTENGTVVSTDATYSFTVTESRNLTANFDEIMSVDDPISKTYGIYPNPVRDFATVMMGDEHINSVQIYHVSGQLVKVLKGNGLNQFQIDMRLYDKTSYIIKVFTDKGVKTFKILRK
ncbi:MAG: T9SS type A sorting domain-containing protein, partial [Flavobacteriia bacterium]|nr:T9SS type A sorting domain-containing protein [Flavobacteriia bacterium]